MRVLVVAPGPDFSVQDVYAGWVKGLRQVGCDVRAFNLNDRLNVWTEASIPNDGDPIKLFDFDAALEVCLEGLRGQLYDFWPDVVVFVSGFFAQPKLLDFIRQRHRVVIVHTESPYEDDRQLALADHVHLNILNDPINIDRYPDGTIYVPHAYDPDVHHPNGRTDEYDFCLVGTGYESRIKWLEKVRWGDARVAIGGNWDAIEDDSPLKPLLLNEKGTCIDNVDTARLYRQSAMSLNLYRREANARDLVEGWAMGPREVELAACGTFFARDSRPESDEVFPMLPVVTDPAELSDILAWSIANPEARTEAANAARAAVGDRTFKVNARRMLAALTD